MTGNPKPGMGSANQVLDKIPDKNAHVEVVCQLSNHWRRPDSYVKLEVDAEDYYRIKDEG